MEKIGVIKMIDWEFLLDLTKKISEIGKNHREKPPVYKVEPFKYYFNKNHEIKFDEIDEFDGKFTRREILSRYLLLSVVLDQGPDVLGVRELLKETTTHLYRQEIRFFHKPIDFFKELNISIDEILEKHESIKKLRKEIWAKANNTNPSKYSLFFTSTPRGIVTSKQVLGYVIHRWGVPLALFILLENENKTSSQPLIDYLLSYPSAEKMVEQLKDHNRYGLGDAIGDKACHLYAKMFVSIFKLNKNKKEDEGWTDISYEMPFDSNAGRVLFRTGFLSKLVSFNDLKKWNVIQEGKGKGGVNYIRVTNIRHKPISKSNNYDNKFIEDYVTIVRNYLKKGTPRTMEISRIPNLILYELNKDGKNYSIADFDDGLMYIGTNYCFNTNTPKCDSCPLKHICEGHENIELITNYKT